MSVRCRPLIRARRPSLQGAARACLIYVAALVGVASVAGSASISRADVGTKSTVVKGPYLQALGSRTVEIRAELDAPAPVVVTITSDDRGSGARVPDAAATSDASTAPLGSAAPAPRIVRDDASATMHVVRIDGLRPATRYAYALAPQSPNAPATRGSFTTAPENDSKASFSFLVYGDNRTDTAAHAAIVRLMLQSPSDFILNTGDLVQDGASDANWQSFFDIEAPLIRERDVFSCVGNHEITDGAGMNYLRYFGPTSDAHGAGETPKLYGSFRWAAARFFLLDAMETFDSGPERAWLDDELSRADAEPGLVWRFVVMHHGPWSSGPHGGNARALKAGIPELFAAHHIDLVIAGHDHIYERGFASGLRYVISGGGGAPLYEIKSQIPSARKAESVHHFVEVTVDGDSTKLVAKRDDGSLLERCGITKGHEGWDCDPPPAPAVPSTSVSTSPPRASACACTTAGEGGGDRDAPFAVSVGLGALVLVSARSRRAGARRDVNRTRGVPPSSAST